MKLNKSTLVAMSLGAAVLLAACGGGSSAPSVASTATQAAINPSSGATVVGAVLNKNFVVATGVPAFGTTTPTTLAFSGTGAAPSFAVSSTQGTASGTTTFGSCIFTVTASTFPTGSPLALGQVATINPCLLNVATAGVVADGSSLPVNASIVLGTITSGNTVVAVSISSSGVITVGGSIVGNATLVPATGAGT